MARISASKIQVICVKSSNISSIHQILVDHTEIGLYLISTVDQNKNDASGKTRDIL